MDFACPEKDVTEILSDSDHSTKVAPTTLRDKVVTMVPNFDAEIDYKFIRFSMMSFKMIYKDDPAPLPPGRKLFFNRYEEFNILDLLNKPTKCLRSYPLSSLIIPTNFHCNFRENVDKIRQCNILFCLLADRRSKHTLAQLSSLSFFVLLFSIF